MVKIYTNPRRLQLASLENQAEAIIIVFSLSGENREVKLNFSILNQSQLSIIVLVSLKNNSQLSLLTTQTHQALQGTSDLLCKAVINQASKFNYHGKVIIGSQGHRAHAYQRNENLIIDTDSSVVSEPSLEILANDVFCTHGAATSCLDETQLYYLQTRGLTKTQAERFLIKGFLHSGLDKLLVNEQLTAAAYTNLTKNVQRALS